jgi:hypothetical protein
LQLHGTAIQLSGLIREGAQTSRQKPRKPSGIIVTLSGLSDSHAPHQENVLLAMIL